MKKIFLYLFILISLVSFAFTSLLSNWEPVPDAKIKFTIDGLLGIDVIGTIGDLKSEIYFFPDDVAHSSISSTISPATIDTQNKKRDKHLRTSDFLDTEKFPAISFVSRSLRKVGEYYVVVGDLTLKSITKSISIPFEFTDSGDHALFVGDFKINRLDYNVGKKSWMMGNDVWIHLNIPVVKK
jgi:polyisoprenoid-binding protein YceI